jgi:PAS domain S-box-containing protein
LFQFSIPYSYILMISALLTGLLSVIALHSKPRQGSVALHVLMSFVTLWSIGYAFELLSHTLVQMMICEKIEFMGIVLVAPSWIVFSLSLIQWKKIKIKKIAVIFFVIPLITLAFVWTNDFHHLFWSQSYVIYKNGLFLLKSEYGPVFWINLAYSYLLLFLGVLFLLYHFIVLSVRKRYRLLYMIIPAIPLCVNILHFIDVNPLKDFDLTPVAFAFASLMFLWTSTRNLEMKIVPLAIRLVMNSIEDGIIVIAHNGKVVVANKAAINITGLSTYEQIQSFLFENYNDLIHSKEHLQVELDGVLKRPYVLLRITPLLGKKKLSGSLISLIDITEQRNAALELRESKVRYETIFTGMRDALLVVNSAAEVLDANNAACNMYGFAYDELLGRKVKEFITDNSKIFIDKFINDTSASFSEAPIRMFNKRFDGEAFPVEVSGTPLNIAGESVVLITVRDITEKVKDEDQLKLREQYLQLLNKITYDALAGQSLQVMLKTLAKRTSELFEASSANITIWDEEEQRFILRAAYGTMHDVCPDLNLQSTLKIMTETVLKRREPIIAEDIYRSPYLSNEISLLYPARSIIALPLIIGDNKLGAIIIFFESDYNFNEQEMCRGQQAANQIALSISYSRLMQKTQELLEETQRMNENLEQRIITRTKQLANANGELRDAYDATIDGWARALELREKETAGHSQRTVDLAICFAKKLNITGEQLNQIRRGALLHDIGKMAIPDSILQKPGLLTPEERLVIEEHPKYSKKLLENIEYLAPAVAIPYYHHEKWDGSGYPEGLKGEEIPLEARLFALVDVWDALCSKRVYREAMTHSEALAYIRNGAGTHFDPILANKFIEMLFEDEIIFTNPLAKDNLIQKS